MALDKAGIGDKKKLSTSFSYDVYASHKQYIFQMQNSKRKS